MVWNQRLNKHQVNRVKLVLGSILLSCRNYCYLRGMHTDHVCMRRVLQLFFFFISHNSKVSRTAFVCHSVQLNSFLSHF